MPSMQTIINKLETCTCGCKGRDPWHQKEYSRAVKKISETEGTVRLPFSKQPVRVIRRLYVTEKGSCFGAWCVDRASIVFDK